MSRSTFMSTSTSDADLLTAFLSGNRVAQDIFIWRHHSRLVKMVRNSIAPDLVKGDFEEDVVQRFWLLLLSKNKSYFDPTKVKALTQLRFLLLTAARDVRADYPLPFQPKRKKKSPELQVTGDSKLTEEPTKVSVLDIELQDSQEHSYNPIDHVLNQADSEWYLKQASKYAASISEVLTLVYEDGLQFTDATMAVGIHRSTMRRRIDRWIQIQNISCIFA